MPITWNEESKPTPKPAPTPRKSKSYTNWKKKYRDLQGKMSQKNTELRELKGMLMKYNEKLRRADLLFAIDTWIRAYKKSAENHPNGETARRMKRMKSYREELDK